MFEHIEKLLRIRFTAMQFADGESGFALEYRDQITTLSSKEIEAFPTKNPRWLYTHIAFAWKLTVDRELDTYDVTLERQQIRKARNIYEVASPYGSRIPFLVSLVTKYFFEKWTDEIMFSSPLLDEKEYVFAYREDTRRGIHTLTMSDLKKMSFDAENIISYASYAMLNEGHKMQLKAFRVQEYTSSDYRITGLLTSFPNLVYDIAKRGAYAYAVSPNAITILPDWTEEDARNQFKSAFSESALPWCNVLFRLEDASFTRLSHI